MRLNTLNNVPGATQEKSELVEELVAASVRLLVVDIKVRNHVLVVL